jgi:glutathione S-transferase
MRHIVGKASSINVRKVLWTCAEAGVQYRHEEHGGDAGLNPNGLVPVLVEGDFVLWESNTICRYLAASNGANTLLPLEPRQRAQVEKWMDWQATDLNSAWRYAFMALVRRSGAHTDEGQLAASVRNWNVHMALLDGQLQAGARFIAGDDFTLADIVLGLSINRWQMTPCEKPDLEFVAAYYERMRLRPGFAAHCANGLP